jgi:hypothetical protein
MSHSEFSQINRPQACCGSVVGIAGSQIIPLFGLQEPAIFVGVPGAPLPIRKQ